MTVDASSEGGDRHGVARVDGAVVVETCALLLAVGGFSWVLLRTGGREPSTTLVGVLLSLPLAAVTRPWRRMPASALTLLAALPIAGLVVGATTPTGFAYSRDLGTAAYVVVLAVGVVSWCRSRTRKAVLTVAVCLLGFLQFFQALVPWVGRGEPTRAMTGTFYQPNAFAAFCVGVAALAFAAAVLGRRVPALVAGLTGPVVAAGVVLSASRSSQALLLLVWLAVGMLAAAGCSRVRRLLVWSLLGAATAGLVVLVTGPAVFDEPASSPIAGTTSRAGTDSLGGSASVRSAYWDAAMEQFLQHLVVGQGHGSFGLTFPDRAPVGSFGSRYAHNGLLQAAAEGGLVLLLPTAGLVLLSVALALRVVVVQRRCQEPSGIAVGGALAVLALVGHAMVDFDWTFPALAALTALMVAICAPVPTEDTTRPRVMARPVLVILLLLGAAASLYATRGSETTTAVARSEAPEHGDAVEVARSLRRPFVPNPLVDVAVLRAAAARTDSVREGEVRTSLRRTADLADLDPNVALLRARVLLALGDEDGAARTALRTAVRHGTGRPYVEGVAARVLADAGREDDAVALLREAIAARSYLQYPSAEAVWQLVSELQRISGVEDSACSYERAVRAFGAATRPSMVGVPQQSCD